MISSPSQKATARQDWRTPPKLFAELERRYGAFDVDVAASADNTHCVRYYDETTDGLAQPWDGAVFCNPPYKDIFPWVDKAIKSRSNPTFKRAVFVLPARTGSVWFFAAYHAHASVIFIRGRVAFCDSRGFPQAGNFEDSLVLVIEGQKPKRPMMVEIPIVAGDL